MTTTETLTGERADLLEALAVHRGFLLKTAEGLTDEQADNRSTVSALTIGGLIRHVADTEAGWYAFASGGAFPAGADGEGWDGGEPSAEAIAAWEKQFRLPEGETLAAQLAYYAEVAARTDALVAGGADLDESHELPPAPWFPKGKRYSVRRVIVHIIAETAQHAGHADIIRETIDGQKTMG